MIDRGSLSGLCALRVVCVCCTSGKLTAFALLFAALGITLAIVATFVPAVIQTKVHTTHNETSSGEGARGGGADSLAVCVLCQLDDGINDYVSLAPWEYEDWSEGFRTFANGADDDSVPIYQSIYMYNIVRHTR